MGSRLKAAVPSFASENTAQRHVFSVPSKQGWFCLAGLLQQPFWSITDFHFPKGKHCWIVSVLRRPPEPSLEKCLVKCLQTGLGFIECFNGYYSWGSNLQTNKMFLKCRIEEPWYSCLPNNTALKTCYNILSLFHKQESLLIFTQNRLLYDLSLVDTLKRLKCNIPLFTTLDSFQGHEG